jgi:hypothetical protein
MPDCTVLGMPLDVKNGDPIITAQPIVAFIVVKVLTEDGREDYLTGATAGLHTVECLGMADYAVEKLRHGLRKRFGGHGPEDL